MEALVDLSGFSDSLVGKLQCLDLDVTLGNEIGSLAVTVSVPFISVSEIN